MGRGEREARHGAQVGEVPRMRWERMAMTDPITCPQCSGRKWEAFGALRLECRFCCGRGTVGGPDDPIENPPPPPAEPPPVWKHKAWRDKALTGTITCRYCLGVGVVSHYSEERRTLISSACPACS